MTEASLLLAWYDRHRRRLPWRSDPGAAADPYAVWLSEIMLQQTTVQAVKPFYLGFLSRWPRVEDLAAASTDDVMRAWAGLGYYSRARNLHACARTVAAEHDGRFPDTEESLRKLPGIGPYTAAAIAAIAFGRRAVVVDGNVERVATRLFSIAEPMPKAKPLVHAATDRLTPEERAGDFAQAMMDLGATICTPRKPACALCPLNAGCSAFRNGNPETFPVKAPKAERPARAGAAFYLRRRDGSVLVRTRPPRGLLGGMTEIPGSEWTPDFDASAALGSAPVPADWRRLPGTVEHVFTHFALRLTVWAGELDGEGAPEGYRFVADRDLDAEALPTVMRKVVAHARSHARATADRIEKTG
ncbi:MAG: A/G-specific adenine glycosylase [Hyphomicrobiales bacterium]|nr:A/G-specific adenine glycosylase [Hyphomicrobiales bacterium]